MPPKNARALAALSQWLNDDAQPAEDDAGYAVTPTFNQLQTLLSHAHRGRSLLAITGSWGIGKSQAARFYAATHPRTHRAPGAVRVQFNSTDRTPAAALARIAEALAATGNAYRNGALMNSIGDALRPGDFLILEECQRLESALDVICSVWDDFGVGIAMIGNPVLSSSIWGKRATVGALASRAERWDFPANSPEDVEAWLAWKGMPQGLNATQRARFLKTCVEIATRPTQNSGLRALADVYRVHAEKYPDQPLTGEFLLNLAGSTKPGPL
jgi:hypothetical protein